MITPDELGLIPTKPGVYIMKDETGKSIYVGKAVSLRQRVRSYFQDSADHSPRTASTVRQVKAIDFITTAAEVGAVAFEWNITKAVRLSYNVLLRIDKQSTWLKVTWQEPYPRVFIVRRPQKDGARYFGPYTNSGSLREILRLLRRVFPIRTCKKTLQADGGGDERPCLNFHIGRCLGPCGRKVQPEEYRKTVQDFCSVLEGKPEELVSSLTKKMHEAAEHRAYEKAAAFRDKLQALQKVVERQVVVSSDLKDRDIFGLAQAEEGVLIALLSIRRGKLIAGDSYYFQGNNLDAPGDLLRIFLLQYYDEREFIPKEILIPYALRDQEVITTWLRRKVNEAVYIIHPRRGEKRRLLKMAMDNAAMALSQEMIKQAEMRKVVSRGLENLQNALHLREKPHRIEAFDISNFQGAEPVASMVVFLNGLPRNDAYRRFKIRGVTGINDFAMLQE